MSLMKEINVTPRRSQAGAPIEADGQVHVERFGDGWLLESAALVAAPLGPVFEFFSDAGNLERLTPNRLHFEILTPRPIDMRVGALIDYRLRLRGIPLRWQSEITAWEPMRRFIDEQRRGPYKYWVHEHLFEARGDETLVVDRVRYGVPGGSIVHTLFVGPDVRGIFRYRAQALNEIFPRTTTA